MGEFEEINEFEFFIVSKSANTVKIGDKLLLMDNLNERFVSGNTKDLNFRKEIIQQDTPLKTNFAMILFCLDGEMRLQLNLKDITIKKNCICSIMPGAIGRLYYVSQDFRSASFFFSNNTFITSLNIQDIIKSQLFGFSNPVIEIGPEKMNEFIDIYKVLFQKISDIQFKYKLELVDAYLNVIKIYSEDIKTQVMRDMPQPNPGRQEVIFDAFINEVIQHFRIERSVKFYAEKLFLSPKYLSKVVKDVSNKLPSDWIREIVILEAKALLRSQKYTVQQISEILNFTSPSFFGRYFREEVGCTPRSYQIDK